MGNEVSIDGLSDSEEYVINPCGSDDIDEMLEGKWNENSDKRRRHSRSSSSSSDGKERKTKLVAKCKKTVIESKTPEKQTKDENCNSQRSEDKVPQSTGQSKSDPRIEPVPLLEKEVGVYPSTSSDSSQTLDQNASQNQSSISQSFSVSQAPEPQQAPEAKQAAEPKQAAESASLPIPAPVPARNSESTDSVFNKLLNAQPVDPYFDPNRKVPEKVETQKIQRSFSQDVPPKNVVEGSEVQGPAVQTNKPLENTQSTQVTVNPDYRSNVSLSLKRMPNKLDVESNRMIREEKRREAAEKNARIFRTMKEMLDDTADTESQHSVRRKKKDISEISVSSTTKGFRKEFSDQESDNNSGRRSPKPKRRDKKEQSPQRRRRRQSLSPDEKIRRLRELQHYLRDHLRSEVVDKTVLRYFLDSHRQDDSTVLSMAAYIFKVANIAVNASGERRIQKEHIMFAVWCFEHTLELNPQQFAAIYKLFEAEFK